MLPEGCFRGEPVRTRSYRPWLSSEVLRPVQRLPQWHEVRTHRWVSTSYHQISRLLADEIGRLGSCAVGNYRTDGD